MTASLLEIERLNRLYAALSQINQAIVRKRTRGELFRGVCSLLVEHGGFSMAWVGWRDPETGGLVPVAHAGDEGGYLQTIELYADGVTEGRGPTARHSSRTDRTSATTCSRIRLRSPGARSSRAAASALRRSFRSSRTASSAGCSAFTRTGGGSFDKRKSRFSPRRPRTSPLPWTTWPAKRRASGQKRSSSASSPSSSRRTMPSSARRSRGWSRAGTRRRNACSVTAPRRSSVAPSRSRSRPIVPPRSR